MAKSKNINKLWNKDEEEYLINNYHNQSWSILLTKLNRHTKTQIIDKASYMNLKRERLWSFDDIEALKNIYEKYECVDDVVLFFNDKYTKKQIIKKANRLGLKNRKIKTKTMSNIDDYIRSNNSKWKEDSLKNNHYKCVFTNNTDIEIHHIYPFHKILNEVFEEMGYDINKEYQLSDSEVSEICKNFFKKQNEYGFGVCVDKEIHKLFHSLYGFINFTSDNWFDFTIRLKNGEYNEILLQKGVNIEYLSKNVVKK